MRRSCNDDVTVLPGLMDRCPRYDSLPDSRRTDHESPARSTLAVGPERSSVGGDNAKPCLSSSRPSHWCGPCGPARASNRRRRLLDCAAEENAHLLARWQADVAHGSGLPPFPEHRTPPVSRSADGVLLCGYRLGRWRKIDSQRIGENLGKILLSLK